jgi:hypothetical protein
MVTVASNGFIHTGLVAICGGNYVNALDKNITWLN